MKLIVGLGNPGIKYKKTRHNLGWQVIDRLAQELKEGKIILLKPKTFMNNSGLAVKLAVEYYKVRMKDILVIHDEIDLPLGKIKIQKNRSAAGHKGVQSIIDRLKTKNFTRVRIGIRPKYQKQEKIDVEKFVLKNFTKSEEKIINKAIKKAAESIKDFLGD